MISMRDESVPGIPLPAEAGPHKWDWRLSVSTILGLVPIIAGLVLIVPEFEKVYRQVRVQLPTMTVALFFVSKAACQYLWLVGVGVVLFTTDVGDWTGRKAKIARIVIPLVNVAILGWIVLALFLPLACSTCSIGARRH